METQTSPCQRLSWAPSARPHPRCPGVSVPRVAPRCMGPRRAPRIRAGGPAASPGSLSYSHGNSLNLCQQPPRGIAPRLPFRKSGSFPRVMGVLPLFACPGPLAPPGRAGGEQVLVGPGFRGGRSLSRFPSPATRHPPHWPGGRSAPGPGAPRAVPCGGRCLPVWDSTGPPFLGRLRAAW